MFFTLQECIVPCDTAKVLLKYVKLFQDRHCKSVRALRCLVKIVTCCEVSERGGRGGGGGPTHVVLSLFETEYFSVFSLALQLQECLLVSCDTASRFDTARVFVFFYTARVHCAM